MKGGDSDNHSDSNNTKTVAAKSMDNSVVMDMGEDGLVNNDPIAIDRAKTSMVFDTYDYDFGDVKQETENEQIFKFKNTGKEPLVITSAKGSCGCTVPQYPKQPIEPGQSGEIKVVYSPGKQQYKQSKTVTITANTDPETTVLKIYANVIPTEGEQAP
jgi:hypothetical protein